jgi:hypothetical protein
MSQSRDPELHVAQRKARRSSPVHKHLSLLIVLVICSDVAWFQRAKRFRGLALLQRTVYPSLDVGEELDRRLEQCRLLVGQIDAGTPDAYPPLLKVIASIRKNRPSGISMYLRISSIACNGTRNLGDHVEKADRPERLVRSLFGAKGRSFGGSHVPNGDGKADQSNQQTENAGNVARVTSIDPRNQCVHDRDLFATIASVSTATVACVGDARGPGSSAPPPAISRPFAQTRRS